MINVSELIHDPDFCQSFVIKRTTAQWVNGRFVQDTPESIPVIGIIHAATEKDLEQIPESDRQKGMFSFFVKPPDTLHITALNSSFSGISDTIEYRGETYRILKVWDDTDFGFVKGIGEQLEAN